MGEPRRHIEGMDCGLWVCGLWVVGCGSPSCEASQEQTAPPPPTRLLIMMHQASTSMVVAEDRLIQMEAKWNIFLYICHEPAPVSALMPTYALAHAIKGISANVRVAQGNKEMPWTRVQGEGLLGKLRIEAESQREMPLGQSRVACHFLDCTLTRSLKYADAYFSY